MQISDLYYLTVVGGKADLVSILPQRVVTALPFFAFPGRIHHLLVECPEVISVLVIKHIGSSAESAVSGHRRYIIYHYAAAVLTIKITHISIPCSKIFYCPLI